MKNPKTTAHYNENKTGFMELVGPDGFSGYYANRFNDVVSFRSVNGKVVNPWLAPCGSGAKIEKLTLFDDNGKRRQVSRRKVLIATLGKDEFERREVMRENRVAILEKEEKQAWLRQQEQEAKTVRELAEMHKDHTPFNGPLLSLDPHVRKMLQEARERKAKKALGDMF